MKCLRWRPKVVLLNLSHSYVNDELTVVLEINHVRVDGVDPARSFREADSIAGRGVPAADRSQLAVVVMTGPVFQHRSVVDERVQVSVQSR